MAEQHFDFHYVKTPTGSISGQSVLKQTEDAINEVGEFSYQASQDAASALQKAEQAVDTANTANNTASNALTQVNAAVEKVNTLEVQVGDIAEQVEQANSKADQAVSTANSALSTAQQALSTANTALTNSENAVTTANSANTTANNANSTAQDALEIAEEAKTTAESAVVDTDSAVEEMTTLLNQATQQATNATQQAQNAAASAASAASAAQSAVDDATEMLNAVVAYIPQNLTEDQQAQARENIAGVGFEDYATASTGGVVKVTGTNGITINGSGEIAVDFSQMPTDKFEDLLKSIRVPIWLTANKSFYVNGETGSDTLDDGRGETSSKPFKTIQACVKYVTENFNIVSYTVTIYVAQGTYNELLTLSDYSRTTGRILIRAQEGQTVKVTNQSNLGNCVRCLSGLWYLQDIDSELSITSANASDSAYFTCPVIASGNSATLYVVNCDLTVNLTVEPQQWLGIICSTAGASVYIDDQSVHSLVNGANYPGKYMFELYSTSSGTIALMAGTTSEQNSITLSGSFYCVAYASDAIIRLTSVYNSVPMQFVDSGVTGMRYYASNGGRIITQGAGPEYFPGTTAGKVSSSTYSFYS